MLEVLGGLLFVLAGALSYLGIVVPGAFGLALLLAGVATVVYALRRPRGASAGAALCLVGMVVVGAVASGGFAMEAPSTTLVFSATRAQVPQSYLLLTARTSAGSIRVSYSADPSLAYRVTFRYAGGRRFFPSFTMVPKLTNSSSGDAFRLNLNGAGAEMEIVLGLRYVLNASLRTSAGNIYLDQDARAKVLSLDCTTDAGNVEIAAVTAPYISCRSSAGNVDIDIEADSTTGSASLSTRAGNINLRLEADSSAAVWLLGATSMGSVIPPQAGGLLVLTNSGTEYEARTPDYFSVPTQFNVSCTSDLGNVVIGFSAAG